MSEAGQIILNTPEQPLPQATAEAVRKPVFTIDVTKFDTGAINALTDAVINASPENKEKAEKALKEHLIKEVEKQLEDQNPGSSSKFNRDMLLGFAIFAIDKNENRSPSILSQRIGQGEDVAVLFTGINGNNPSALAELLSGLPQDRLKPMPGNPMDFIQFVAEHEAYHANKYHRNTGKPDLDLKYELESDANGIKKLKEKNQPELIQAIIDMRVVGAVNGLMSSFSMTQGPTAHATGFFLNPDGTTKPVGPEQVDKLFQLKETMLNAVALKMEISLPEAQQLFKEDPAKFNKLLEEAIKEGKLGGRVLKGDELHQAIAKEAGMTASEFNKLREQNPEEFDKKYAESYKKLLAENKHLAPDPEIQNWAKMYLEGYNRRINDTPQNAPANAPPKQPIEPVPAEPPAASATPQSRSIDPPTAAPAPPPQPAEIALPVLAKGHLDACITATAVALYEKEGVDPSKVNQALAGKNETATDYRQIASNLFNLAATPAAAIPQVQDYLIRLDQDLIEMQIAQGTPMSKIAPALTEIQPIPAQTLQTPPPQPAANNPFMTRTA